MLKQIGYNWRLWGLHTFCLPPYFTPRQLSQDVKPKPT
jgi:hypothetical protein